MNYLIENINNYDINKINELKKYINYAKLKKIEKITNQKYKTQKIIGELILIKGLKEFFNIDYRFLSFDINKNGKPYITNNHNIHFNISHSHNYCICAFSNKQIGVDIEKIRKTNINVINKFATNKEIQYILKEKNNIYERLFEIYTLKEAYFKMKGENLKNIKNIEFEIKDNKIICSDDTVELIIKKDINGYIIAYCEKKYI